MAQLVSIISAISGICSIIKFGESQFAKASADDAQLKMEVGLDYKGGLSGAGGDLPDVRLWNEAGSFIGMEADPGSIDDGTQGEMSVGSKGQQPTYALFSANDDAICVAYVSIKWPTGDDDQYGWEGSWGKQCGGSWYWSHIYINSKDYKPPCLWIDANGDQPQTGFSLHWPEFVSKTGQVPDGKDPSYFCENTPVFALHTEEDPSGIDFWPLGNHSRIAARAEPAPPINKNLMQMNRRSAKTTTRDGAPRKGGKKTAGKRNGNIHANRLVVSDDAVNHPTAELCESETSVGPDFVNKAEGQYCRMEDKTLWPLCDASTTDDCFNLATHTLVIGGKSARDTPYDWVQDWSESSD